ncbi:MAG: hypothetical protein AAB481_03000 [Patescibacteria group bacterium]
MLTKRTHILFDEDTAFMLAALAREKATSVGNLVRHAIKKTYTDVRHTHRSKRQKAVRALLDLQKKFLGRFEGMDYRALIEDGRKY